jgi:hypothetical protein
MTFIPSVLSKYDSNNSGTGTTTSFVGTSTAITGYLSININIDASNNSVPNGIIVYTSTDNSTFTTFFTDTYFANTNYQKTVNLTCKYYKLSVDFGGVSTTYTIVTYLNTDFNQDGDNGVYLPAKVEAHYDAFGKLRVSNPYTLIDLKYPPLNSSSTPSPGPSADYLKNNLQMICDPSGNTGGANATYQNSQAVFTQTGSGTITSQSRKYAIYQPGKSLLCLASFVLNTSTSTSSSYALRVGYFDNYNGVFLQYTKSTSTISFVVRSGLIGGTPTDTSYNQVAWNIDKLDGTGNSGILLDFFTKAQLLVIDLEWLSVGRVRCGFMCFGKIVYCHQITNVNSLTGPYMYTANLPVRYQVVNNTTGTAVLTKICATVISEGGYRPSGNIFSVSTRKLTSIPVAAEYSVLFLTGNKNTTLNSNYYHNEVVLRSLSIYCATSADVLQYRIRLYLPGDSPGGPASSSYAAVASTSVIQYYDASNNTTIAGNSIILDQGYVTATAIVNVLENVSDYILNNNSITSSIDNSQIGYIVVTLQSLSNTGNFDVYVSLNWAEF